MITYEQLVNLCQEKKATLVVNRINHREFIYDGRRYIAGYNSERDPRYKQTSWDEPIYKVMGWLVYNVEIERNRIR